MSRLLARRRSVVPTAGLAAGLAAVLLAACTGGASPSPTPPPSLDPGATPGASPESSPTTASGDIAHPTGAADLVLRFGEGGGFVMPAFAMVQVPHFSLFGDGTVIYRPASEPFPETKPGEPIRFPQLRVARMTEEQVQALLADALGAGGLAVAKPRYENQQVADAPTALFTFDVEGSRRQVSVYALGIGPMDPANPGPDDEILAALAALGERLRNFDQEVAKGNATDLGRYSPTAFRASLLEDGFAQGPARPWPWPTFGPDGFAPFEDGTSFGFPSRVLSGLEVALLGVDDPAGGVSGIVLAGPAGKTYSLGLRPLLPDELA
jgi:hypothetical protein